MAGNKPINKPLRGIRDSIPAGYILGRASGGNGPPILLPAGTFASKGFVANTTIQIGGAAGGDLGGTYPNPTVTGLQGRPVSNSAPTNGQALEWNGSAWVPATVSGGAPASIQDTGSAILMAISSADGQLVLDGSGNPVFSNEVFPNAAIPPPTASALGGVKSLAAVSHNFLTSITTAGLPVAAQPSSADLSDVSSGTWTPTDQSGASLSITVNYANYLSIGKFSLLSFSVTYPTTANTSAAQISAPFVPYTDSKPGPSCLGNSTYPVSGVQIYLGSTGTIGFADAATGAQLNNNNLSTYTFTASLIIQNAA